MKLLLSSLRLAFRDWIHEWRLSICSVLALASILLPLLVIHGVHMGVITTLKTRLMTDPSILVVMPISGAGAGFSEEFIEKIRAHKATDFVIGRTRDVASEMQLVTKNRYLTVTLEPTGDGDPLLRNAKVPVPEGLSSNYPGIVLTQAAAARLGIKRGDEVEGRMSRRLTSGKKERLSLRFKVCGVLPVTAMGRESAFVPLETLNAVQDYRDALAVPVLQVSGDYAAAGKRFYESFRLYARSLEGVEALDSWFNEQHLLVRTKAKEIAGVRKMDEALTSIVVLISAVVIVGFVAYMISVVSANSERKKKALGTLRLLGFTRASLTVFPIFQAFLTGVFGSLVGLVFYAGLSQAINALMAGSTEAGAVCSMPWMHLAMIFVGVVMLAACSALLAGRKAAAIEPSAVLRDM